jgi:LacI family transcriptional regulator
MTTIKDIAKHAGVSIATVSRVLNNNAAVNEATRYTVLKAAQELDYPVDNLRSKNQINRTVLVVTREDDQSVPPSGQPGVREFERHVWSGVHSVLETRGIATRLQQSRMTLRDAEQYAHDVTISGLILLGGILDPDFVEHLLEFDVPFVVAGSHLQPLKINAVMTDVAQGVRQSVEYLVGTGRRHIGFVNGPSTTLTSLEKLEGLHMAFALLKLEFDPQHHIISDFSADDGYRKTLELIHQAPDIDAIIYAEDTIAMGGMRALKEQGYTIPNDISIIGFGDYDIARYTDPALTTVQFDMRLMGRIAARRLSMLLDEPDDDQWLVRIPTSLIVREST